MLRESGIRIYCYTVASVLLFIEVDVGSEGRRRVINGRNRLAAGDRKNKEYCNSVREYCNSVIWDEFLEYLLKMA